MRINVCGQGISLDVTEEWRVANGWTEPTVQELHGIYLASCRTGLQFHVRRWPTEARATTIDGLRCMFHDQWSAFPPLDDGSVIYGALTVACATFETPEQVVTEFFASDGAHVVNATLPGPRAAVLGERPSALRLLGSVRFEDAARREGRS